MSHIWIFFTKEDTNSKCNICDASIARKDGSTTGMVFHLKRHHDYLKKYNAWKIYEELSQLKETRLKGKKRKLFARLVFVTKCI